MQLNRMVEMMKSLEVFLARWSGDHQWCTSWCCWST